MYELKTSGNIPHFPASFLFCLLSFFFSFIIFINPICVSSELQPRRVLRKKIPSTCPGGDLINLLVFLFIAAESSVLLQNRYGVTVTLNRTTEYCKE